MIDFADFQRVEMATGTIVAAERNPKAPKAPNCER